jgi:hypothetical protein
MTPVNILYILQPKLFRSAFCFENITYSTARDNFALHGIAPEDDFWCPACMHSDLTFSKRCTGLL